MSRKSKADSMLPLIGFVGVIVFFLSKSAFGASKPMNTGNVQTATVGDRVYSVAKLGQGHYMISLVSTAGVLQSSPVNLVINQTEETAAFGDARKISQLRSDMQFFQVNFAT